MNDARDRWLDAGIQVLTEGGAAAVRIDRIAVRVGLSKGSFHHHFDGAEGYKRDLLAYFERLSVEALESSIADAGPTASAREVLTHLTALLHREGPGLYTPRLDGAVRAWAASDDDARAVVARVDRVRLDALESVWERAAGSGDRARLSALLPYLVALGAGAIIPAVDMDDLRGVYEILLPLVPEQ